MNHWVPYDEARLFTLLGVDRAAVGRWLRRDDIHDLAQLVRRRGLDPRAVAEELVDAWAGAAPQTQRSVLHDRAVRTLTQGHLAQHLFFHFAHYPEVALRARSVFGVGPLAYRRFRLAGWTPSEIARSRGRSPAGVSALADAILRTGAARGVASYATPPAQAELMLTLQRQNLGAWLEQRIRPVRGISRAAVPSLRSPRELACWLFAGPAGLRQLRRPAEARAASFVCSVRTDKGRGRR